jgi:hypothetical protein
MTFAVDVHFIVLHDRRRLCHPTRLGFISSISLLSKPISYCVALSHLECNQLWMREIAALKCTSTWYLVLLPSSASTITCKWVYKIKSFSDVSIERYKV